jgi:hypothetical protein
VKRVLKNLLVLSLLCGSTLVFAATDSASVRPPSVSATPKGYILKTGWIPAKTGDSWVRDKSVTIPVAEFCAPFTSPRVTFAPIIIGQWVPALNFGVRVTNVQKTQNAYTVTYDNWVRYLTSRSYDRDDIVSETYASVDISFIITCEPG